MACVLALAAPAGATAQGGAMPFSNPVIPGNVADPSVVRADGSGIRQLVATIACARAMTSGGEL